MIERGRLYVNRYLKSVGRVGLGLLILTALEIAILIFLRVAAPHSFLELCVQVALAFTFAALAAVDLRTALAVAVLELIVGGASGRWTELPGGLTGRMMLDGVLGVVAVVHLARRIWADGLPVGRRSLGRYGLHALAIAILVPAIWMPLGLLNGNSARNVLADGDGFLFFGFALVLAAAALSGDLSWLRRWLLAACAINAMVTVALFALGLSRVIPPFRLRALLLGPFDFGGDIAILASGIFRLHLASGLFLQVGVTLVTWELIRNPRRVWPWLLSMAFAIGLFATYSRGYWLGAFVAAAVVLILGHTGLRQRAAALGRQAAVLALVIVMATIGFSLLEAGAGMSSNLVKLHQAQILLGHIAERPLFGWGFGSIAPDYPYGTTFSYEITYLDRAFKTGLLGLALFVSFPLRLLVDAVRILTHRLPPPSGMTGNEAAVPLAILTSVLIVGATNPYLAGSVGIGAVILAIAWLDPLSQYRE